MNENEEIVYSKMGLDPILLLEEVTKSENNMVHIIRHGEEESIEEIKNNKDIITLENKSLIDQKITTNKETKNMKEEEEEINIDLDEGSNSLIIKDELNSTETKEADEDPRRKRRRSSASS